MRITDPQVIQDGEKDLIASVQRDLDLEAVKDLLTKRLTANALSPKAAGLLCMTTMWHSGLTMKLI